MQRKEQGKMEKYLLSLTSGGKRAIEAMGLMLPLTAAAFFLLVSRKGAYG